MRIAVAILLLAGCATISAPTASPAETYRALGNEPFWTVTVANGRLTYESPEGGFSVAAPSPRTTFNGHRYETRRIVLDITHAQCSDGMSDRVYPDSVMAIVDGRELRGCGGEPMAPAALAGTDWRIVSIGGTEVGGERYVLSFAEDRLSGRAGCNRFSGRYRLAGGTLTVGPLAMTRMACASIAGHSGPDPMAMERLATQILEGEMRASFPDGDTLVLRGNGGEIRLRRAI
jgi:heat shock protein HslJ